MAVNYFRIYNTINNISVYAFSTETFNVEVSGEGTWAMPAPTYETIQIPGRNGISIVSNPITDYRAPNNFPNVDITYRVLAKDASVLSEMYNRLCQAVNGTGSYIARDHYYFIEDSYHPGIIREGVLKSISSANFTQFEKSATLDVTFSCLPQKFTREGLIGASVTALTPPTRSLPALPFIRMSAGATLRINPYLYSSYDWYLVNNHTSEVSIDCETYEIFYANGKAVAGDVDIMIVNAGTTTEVSGIAKRNNGFPYIDGAKTVTTTGTVTIAPRWYTL